MLQLLELLEKALAPLALLAGILFALAQTAKILLTLDQTDQVPRILKLPEGMWQKAGRAFGSWPWLASYKHSHSRDCGDRDSGGCAPRQARSPAPVEGDSLGRAWLRGAGHSGVRISRSGPDQD